MLACQPLLAAFGMIWDSALLTRSSGFMAIPPHLHCRVICVPPRALAQPIEPRCCKGDVDMGEKLAQHGKGVNVAVHCLQHVVQHCQPILGLALQLGGFSV